LSTASITLPIASERPSARSTLVIALFVWLLPFHSLLMALLLGPFGLPITTVRTIAAWKEVAVLALLAAVIVAAFAGKGARSPVSAPDVAVSTLLGIGLLFLVTENAVFRAGIPRSAELIGFRDTLYFLLLYYVGRSIPDLVENDRLLKHLLAIGIVLSIVAIAERIFVDTETLLLIGVATYMQDFLGLAAFTEGTGVGLPQNYWTLIGGVAVRRAGSAFLHSQGFALPFLLIIPAATAWVLGRDRPPGTRLRIGYALLWTGLLLTLTRMTIMTCALQVVLFYMMVRRPEWAMGTVLAGVAVFAVALALVPGMAAFVWQTLTWQELSSESHLGAWSSGIVAFLEQPWGHGLGTVEAAAARAGLVPITGDNLFLSYGVQLGLLGLIAQVTVLLTMLRVGWRAFRDAAATNPVLSRLGAVVALASIGILVNGATSLVFGSTYLAYLYFLTAGALVTLAQQNARRRSFSAR
jgi:hypothetical protein